MIKAVMKLDDVKRLIRGYQDKEVQVTLNMGRNKILTFNGKLTGVYPALFTVSPFEEGFNGKTSYSYSEFMCGKVKLKRIPESS